MILNARRRASIAEGLRQGLPVIGLYLLLECCIFLALPERAKALRPEGLIVVGLLGLWRYAWQAVHILRSLLYQYRVFPRWRARADALPAERAFPDRLYVVIASYREEAWITQRMLQALIREAETVPSKVTVIVSTGGAAEDAVFLRVLDAHPNRDAVDLVFMHQQHGKRIALGHALRAASRRERLGSSLTVFMDGDTVLGPDVLRKTLPLFHLFPYVGALTTDELSLVDGARWYRQWYALRFSQRHRLMKSLSLSRRVLTLTGRFSVFRTEIATDPEFLRYLEDDSLDHWLYGRFQFLTGDDKSTWFYVLKQGWEMLYVPDAVVYSMESAGPQPFRTSIAKMYRWFGNMLRNNGRAIQLGPRRMGFFTWWCLVDQRVSIWTSLVGPTGAVLLAAFANPFYLVLYLYVAVLARLFYLFLLCFEGHLLSYYHVPQLFYTQWVGALVKVHVLFRLDRQSWGAARGGRSLRALPGPYPWLKRVAPGYLTTLSVLVFLTAVAVGVGVLRLPAVPRAAMAEELHASMWARPLAPPAAVRVRATDFGAVPGDARADSDALEAALAALPPTGPGCVELPAGELLLDRPLRVARDHTWLLGQGRDATVLRASFTTDVGAAALDVAGSGRAAPAGARLAEPRGEADRLLYLDSPPARAVEPGDVVWLGAPNAPDFLATLEARVWKRETPWLRQTMAEVAGARGNVLLLRQPLGCAFPRGARIARADVVTDVHLAGFTLQFTIPDAEAASATGRYENRYPAYAVDGLRFHWAARCSATEVAIVMAGRHPVHLDNALQVTLRDLWVDGAWNKGPEGMGYVRFSRSYRCLLADSHIRNIRHVVFQWSAAHNRVARCRFEVDVNFHGGYSRDNFVRDCEFALPASHPWPPIVRTRTDAHWAPPDGLGNRVRDSL